MKQRRIDNEIEHRIITGMIVSDKYIKQIHQIYQPDFLAIPFAKTVANWCLDFYQQYEKAPGIHIQDIFNSESRRGLAPDQIEMIAAFLEAISHEYEHGNHFNADYLLDQTEARFNSRNLILLAEDVKAFVLRGELIKAEETVLTYKKVSHEIATGINPLIDEDAIFNAFENIDKDILFTFPGELGKMLGPVSREDFVSFMGPEKRGKTWWLLEVAKRANRQKCNVAFFGAGDMSEPQYVRRIHISNSRMNYRDRYCGQHKSPVLDCSHNQHDTCSKAERTNQSGCMHEIRRGAQMVWEKFPMEDVPDYRPCTFCLKEYPKEFKGAVWHEHINIEKLSWQKAYELGKRTADRSKKTLKLSCHPNSTLTVRGMESILNIWESAEGFIPDVIVVDYADILAPENTTNDPRHQINDIWKALRALGQKRRAAIITATQADADSYNRKSLNESNFSEDKRKYGHATMFITLNQTPEEKKDMIMRLGQMFVREDEFDITQQTAVLQNLKIGQPYLTSYLA